ncbi:hypothetical protein Hanom_Chr07g00635371 [Helianthus anomalus]
MASAISHNFKFTNNINEDDLRVGGFTWPNLLVMSIVTAFKDKIPFYFFHLHVSRGRLSAFLILV